MNDITFKQIYERYQTDLETELLRHIPPSEGSLAEFYGMMRYHMGWADHSFHPVIIKGGKRLRPILCLAACEAAGADFHRALPVAAALEIIHNYSLVHDDVEDHSEQRRHRATVWAIWGPALAINVGDGLFSLAKLASLRLRDVGVDAETVLEISELLERTCLHLCEGQHLDMTFETLPAVTMELYYEMVGKKTGALLAASAETGAFVASKDKTTSMAYGEFGRALGLAFQIQDDILGIWGSAGITGKGATDLFQHKKTLPIVYAMDNASATDKATLLELYDGRALDDQKVAVIIDVLERAGAKQFAEAEAERHFQHARHLLQRAKIRGQRVGRLEAIADFLMGRSS